MCPYAFYMCFPGNEKSQCILIIYTIDLKMYIFWKQEDGQNTSLEKTSPWVFVSFTNALETSSCGFVS